MHLFNRTTINNATVDSKLRGPSNIEAVPPASRRGIPSGIQGYQQLLEALVSSPKLVILSTVQADLLAQGPLTRNNCIIVPDNKVKSQNYKDNNAIVNNCSWDKQGGKLTLQEFGTSMMPPIPTATTVKYKHSNIINARVGQYIDVIVCCDIKGQLQCQKNFAHMKAYWS